MFNLTKLTARQGKATGILLNKLCARFNEANTDLFPVCSVSSDTFSVTCEHNHKRKVIFKYLTAIYYRLQYVQRIKNFYPIFRVSKKKKNDALKLFFCFYIRYISN